MVEDLTTLSTKSQIGIVTKQALSSVIYDNHNNQMLLSLSFGSHHFMLPLCFAAFLVDVNLWSMESWFLTFISCYEVSVLSLLVHKTVLVMLDAWQTIYIGCFHTYVSSVFSLTLKGWLTQVCHPLFQEHE